MTYRVEYPNGSVLFTDDREHTIEAADRSNGVVTVAADLELGAYPVTLLILEELYDPWLEHEEECDVAWDKYVDEYNGERFRHEGEQHGLLD